MVYDFDVEVFDGNEWSTEKCSITEWAETTQAVFVKIERTGHIVALYDDALAKLLLDRFGLDASEMG